LAESRTVVQTRRKYLKYIGSAAAGVVVGALGTYGAIYRPPPPPVVAPRPLERYGGILKVVVDGEAPELDPQVSTLFIAQWVEEEMFEGLVKFGLDMTIAPALAWRWQRIDPKTFEFYLRDNVKFHNGRKMTSADVKYSFERIKDPATGSPQNHFFQATIDSIDTPDDYTVRLNLKAPTASLLGYLGTWGPPFAIVCKENVEAGESKTKPIGTGPFKFKEWVKGDHITLTGFKDYWDPGLPYADELRFDFQGESSVMVSMLKARTVDQASPIFPTDIPAVDTSEVTNKVQPISGYHWICVNTKVKPYDDVRVRQAIAHAIDKTEVTQLVWYGLARPIDSPLMYFEPCYSPVKAPEYDPQKAKELLAEAGYPDGFSDTLTAVPITEDTKVATVAAAQLERVGIRLKIETPELSTYVKIAIIDKTFHVAQCGNTDPPEPDYILSKFYETGGSLNMANYSNPEVDGLFKQAREEYDDVKRTDLYRRIQEIVLPDAPYVWLENPPRIYAWWRDLQGYTPHSDLSQCFSTVWSPKLEGR